MLPIKRCVRISSPAREYCRVPKLFRSQFSPERLAQDMKLNRRKVHRIIRQKLDGVPSKDIAKDLAISSRRVEQLWKYYKDHRREPINGKGVGRPKKPYDEKEAQMIKDAHLRFRFGARMLEIVLKKMYEVTISHNRILMIWGENL